MDNTCVEALIEPVAWESMGNDPNRRRMPGRRGIPLPSRENRGGTAAAVTRPEQSDGNCA